MYQFDLIKKIKSPHLLMLLMNAITSSLPKQSLVLPCKFIKIWHLSFITYASRFVFEGVQIKDCIDQSC